MNRQQGAALLLLVMVLVVVASFLFLQVVRQSHHERDKVTALALAQAKDALIGYAATYREQPGHANDVFGFLPCPDTTNDGEADAPCGLTEVSSLGRLPWKTLGLSPLRDSASECLWYAVAGRAKESPKSATALNWDSSGQFIVQDAAGTTLAGSSPAERPLAVILAPRLIIGEQARPPTGASECGGSNTPTDYLEGIGPLTTGDTTLTLATAASAMSGANNDQGAWITPHEVFARIKQRGDFRVDLDLMLTDLASCLNSQSLLPADSGSGSKGITTALESQCPPPAAGSKKGAVYANWRDNLLYRNAGGLVDVNGSSCSAVLLLAGERTANQARSTAVDQANPANYLEAANLTSFTAGGSPYAGATSFNTACPGPNQELLCSQDVPACITGTAVPPDVSFEEDIAAFVPAGSSGGSQVTVNPDGSATLFITGASNKSGCFWFPSASVAYNKTMRLYFKFRFRDIEGSTTSSSYGDGFTFAVLPGNANVAHADGMCGRANQTGYSGTDGGGHAPLPLPTPNLAIEYDSFYNLSYQDPAPANKNHIAILTGTLGHGGSSFATPCNGTGAGCYPVAAPNWLEDNMVHQTRVEVVSGCTDGSCSTCGASGAYALIKAWVDCTDCNALGANFAAPPDIKSCTAVGSWLNATANTVKFGFTSGESSGVRQTIDLSDFAIKFQ